MYISFLNGVIDKTNRFTHISTLTVDISQQNIVSPFNELAIYRNKTEYCRIKLFSSLS